MAEKLFNVQVICPDRQFFNGDAEMLELKTTEGEIGILAGHIPLTAVLAPGVMRIINGDDVKEAALHDGFVEILGDRVIVLADSCEWPGEIDVNRAEEAKKRAEERLQNNSSDINEMRAEFALRKSLIRIDLAQKYSK